MPFISRPRRPRRSGEWTADRVVTFIVTLATTRSVTLAARAAAMSRKSAYALKSRDPAFAAAWTAAIRAGAHASFQGDKVDEVEGTPFSLSHGDLSPLRSDRKRCFAAMVEALRESAPLAPGAAAQ